MVAERSGSITKTLLSLTLIAVAMAAATSSASNTLDTRLLGRPKTYTSHREDWPGFKFVLKSYVGAVSSVIRTKMDAAERSAIPIGLNTMGTDTLQEASTLVRARRCSC